MEIAARFVEEGARVVCADLGGAEATMDKISRISGLSDADSVAVSIDCDISDQEAVCSAYGSAAEHFGDARVDVLVNNAARFIFHSVETAEPEDWDAAASVNIRGHALMTKHALPGLKSAGGGSIVFMGSISGFIAQPSCATYSTFKGAIGQLAKNCAYDLARYNVRVNTVCPGTIFTPASLNEMKEQGWTREEWDARKVPDVMLGRVGHVREVANATLFFASDESSYCTGADLLVDGGQTSCSVMTWE